MIDENRTRGVEDALAVFGIIKQASILQDVKNILVGDPGRYLQQLRNGSLFTRKGMIAQSMNPMTGGLPPVVNAALMYGLPAMGVTQALKSEPGQRGSAVGSTVGSLVGGAIGGPLGLVGNIAGGVLGSSLGESIGRNFNARTPQRETDRRPA